MLLRRNLQIHLVDSPLQIHLQSQPRATSSLQLPSSMSLIHATATKLHVTRNYTLLKEQLTAWQAGIWGIRF